MSLCVACIGLLSVGSQALADHQMCDLRYNLPADINLTYPFPPYAQLRFDQLSWQSFLALNAPWVGARVTRRGDNRTQWSRWSSTDDLIQCQRDPDSCDCPEEGCQSGDRYYPTECQSIKNYKNYRVLGEVAKVDDLFLEAATGGLSNDPVLNRRGKFLRYEILVSPATYDFVVGNEYYDADVLEALGVDDPVIFICGQSAYTRGNPANPEMGAIVMKNAWMPLRKRDRRLYHTEKLLVWTPGYRNSTGEASCKLEEMALVGMHIDHKTTKQPNWIWSTFEHRLNAPDCTELPPAGDMAGSGPSTACPTSVSRPYNFFPKRCSADGNDPDACQTCNAAPVSNADGCTNPDVTDDTSWCLDLPPASDAGITRACRQVPVEANYPTAHRLNQACKHRLGYRSVWRNYQLISTQWFPSDSSECQASTSRADLDRTEILPQVDVSGDGSDTRPILGNTSMETYVRSNCMACHADSTVDGTTTSASTDMMYWLQLEVAATGDDD
jgi:hypothetical protein